ncbi:D-tyrosyl-tRNA(Tyr) deacylase [Candidatus Woesearchaeota archaeon]|nr:D-tyrosyl-tRNA(Tyr) deacylase [Candidatus Woesearchaeota archaeon]
MKIALLFTTKDPASMNIRENLLKLGVEKDARFELHTIEGSLLHSEETCSRIHTDAIIFCSKHQSSAGVHSMTVHFTGNWGKADLGGKDSELSMASPSLAKNLFLELKQRAAKEWEVTLEATHHGPRIAIPSLFIEIGSNEEMWKDHGAGKIIAETILAGVSDKKCSIALGLGSTHYPLTFNRVMAETNVAMAHICPKHALQFFDEAMLEKALEASSERVDLVLLDWKGMGGEKQRIVELLEQKGVKWRKSSSIVAEKL